VKALDIELLDPVTGMRYQPSDYVTVRIEMLDANPVQDEEVDVVHFGNWPEVLDTSVNGETVEFESTGFSVYVVIKHEGD
jgi:hypothetical protein